MKTAFATFVYGTYQKFLPYYVYGISKNYPDSKVLVFYQGAVDQLVKDALKEYSQVILYEDSMTEMDWMHHIDHKGAAKQSLRHLMPHHYFKDYDAVYFGDVDILILEEPTNLFNFHTAQANEHNLPFSNKVRSTLNNKPSRRLTGLHFILVQPYYEGISPLISKVIDDEEYRNELFSNTERNEEVLYYLNQEAFAFDPQKLLHNKRPWHGFHLGLVRGKNYLNKKTIAENSDLTLTEITQQLTLWIKDAKVLDYLVTYPCIEFYRTLKYLKVPLPKRTHKVYQKIERKIVLRKLKKRIKKLLKRS